GRNIQHSHKALANPFGGSTNSGKEPQVKGLLAGTSSTRIGRLQILSVAQPIPAKKPRSRVYWMRLT
ncbi:MAG TPA: hypothetical protein PKK09_02005, partial [Anaerolineaceae bacterium]|nr:hypothetical protein [Anaerolineaceae bacterium]HNW14285.1 hypothetical protein [Anaerolineaceae bacterium]